MVQLKLFKKPKHRADYSHARAMYADLYAVLHRAAHFKGNNVLIKRLAVFFVTLLAPRPARGIYTKGLKNLELQKEATE